LEKRRPVRFFQWIAGTDIENCSQLCITSDGKGEDHKVDMDSDAHDWKILLCQSPQIESILNLR
jgi:hypothetical protein